MDHANPDKTPQPKIQFLKKFQGKKSTVTRKGLLSSLDFQPILSSAPKQPPPSTQPPIITELLQKKQLLNHPAPAPKFDWHQDWLGNRPSPKTNTILPAPTLPLPPLPRLHKSRSSSTMQQPTRIRMKRSTSVSTQGYQKHLFKYPQAYEYLNQLERFEIGLKKLHVRTQKTII